MQNNKELKHLVMAKTSVKTHCDQPTFLPLLNYSIVLIDLPEI